MMSKPYFETDLGKLYHGDCLEIMPEFKDKEFDLVLTDPPYGIGYDKKAHQLGGQKGLLATKTIFPATNWDNATPPSEAFEQMRRISKNQIIFGGNYFIKCLDPSPCWLVWDKKTNGNFADCELAYTSFKMAVKKFEYRWNGMLKENPEKRYHATQKPVGLFKQILLKYAEKGQSICDPYAGSGTTALACEAYGFKWVCIEKEQDYCDIIVKRLRLETQQIKLFN